MKTYTKILKLIPTALIGLFLLSCSANNSLIRKEIIIGQCEKDSLFWKIILLDTDFDLIYDQIQIEDNQHIIESKISDVKCQDKKNGKVNFCNKLLHTPLFSLLNPNCDNKTFEIGDDLSFYDNEEYLGPGFCNLVMQSNGEWILQEVYIEQFTEESFLKNITSIYTPEDNGDYKFEDFKIDFNEIISQNNMHISLGKYSAKIIESFEIYDSDGILQLTHLVNGANEIDIDVHSLKNGTYILQIIIRNFGKSATKGFLIAK